MLIKSTRLEPKFSFRGTVAEYAVYATTEDGVEHAMFRFFTDEKFYTERSFVGMTIEDAFSKFRNDDVFYLRS